MISECRLSAGRCSPLVKSNLFTQGNMQSTCRRSTACRFTAASQQQHRIRCVSRRRGRQRCRGAPHTWRACSLLCLLVCFKQCLHPPAIVHLTGAVLRLRPLQRRPQQHQLMLSSISVQLCPRSSRQPWTTSCRKTKSLPSSRAPRTSRSAASQTQLCRRAASNAAQKATVEASACSMHAMARQNNRHCR